MKEIFTNFMSDAKTYDTFTIQVFDLSFKIL